jgi:hypothetical protein
MEQLIYLDTHAAVWLYTDKIEKFPAETLKTQKPSFAKTIQRKQFASEWEQGR